jgi:hypothetical protein
VTSDVPKSQLAVGAHTLPDAARLVGLPLPRLRARVLGRDAKSALGYRGMGKDRTFDFYTLIELFTIGQLRSHGLSWPTLRKARAELIKRFRTPHPLALRELLVDGPRLLPPQTSTSNSVPSAAASSTARRLSSNTLDCCSGLLAGKKPPRQRLETRTPVAH